mgnify:CR=1 FL=1
MKCAEEMELMQRYLDHDLLDAEQSTLFAHLECCPECTVMLEKLQRLSDDLANLPKVFPSVSLVDLILPQLEQMAALPAPTPAIDTAIATQIPSIADFHPRKRLFTWKWVSGITAAAILFGIFYLNQDDLGFNGDFLFSYSNRQETTSVEKNSAAMSTSRVVTPKSENILPTLSVTFSEQTNTSKSEPTATPNVVSNGTPAHTPSPIANKAAASVKPSVKPSSPSASPVPTQDTFQEMKTSPPTSTFTSTDAQAKMQAPTPTPQPEALRSSGEYSAKPSQESGNNTQNPSAMGMMMKPQQLDSTDGNYIGFVDQQKVYIKDRNGVILFASNKQWSQTDTIQLVRWVTNTKLIYKVKASDGTTKESVIDLNTASEVIN